MKLIIYTDGSCLGNPGKGGWAFLAIEDIQDDSLVTLNGIRTASKSGGESLTTNNRMELTAFLNALEAVSSLPDAEATIYSDSTYVTKGYSEWMDNWDLDSFATSVKNADLWVKIRNLKSSLTDRITVKWVKGHATDQYNIAVDKLARKAAEAV